MENNNTFNPPVDTGESTPSPAESPNPTNPEEPESTPSPADQPSEEHGYTSNEQGYGVNEDGTDKAKEDLSVDPDYFNAQAHRGANALYAAAEDEMSTENQAFEDEWNAEDEEKERRDKIRLALAGARDAIKDANDRLDAIEAMIQEENERAERILAERRSSKVIAEESTSDTPADTAALPAAEARSDFATAGSQPISSTEAGDIKQSSATAPNTDVSIPPQGETRYLGKDNLVYSDRQQAIDSFKD